MARAVALLLALLVLGAGCIIAGIHIILGLGAALIAGGAAFFALAWLVRAGLT